VNSGKKKRRERIFVATTIFAAASYEGGENFRSD
jgi:hypothetical protein